MRTRRVVTKSVTLTIEVEVDATVAWIDDSGVWRDRNGDGEPPSTEFDGVESFGYDLDEIDVAIHNALDAAIDGGKFDE